MEKTIGTLIDDVLRRKGMAVTEFAKQIGCERNNVYNIIRKADISIVQLRKISEVLEYNFFKDLADDFDLIQNTENNSIKAEEQFLEVIHKVLKKLEVRGMLYFGLPDYIKTDIPLPDYSLAPYFITFTVGETIEERLKGQLDNIMIFKRHSKGKMFVTECKNKVSGTQTIDIKIDYKTEQEWEDIIAFAVDIAEKVYNEYTCRLVSDYYNEMVGNSEE